MMIAEEIKRLDWGVEECKRHNGDIRRLGVLYEDIDSKFRLLMEGFGAMDRKFDALEEKIDKKFEEIDYKFEYVFEKLEALEAKIDKKLDREEFLLYIKNPPGVR